MRKRLFILLLLPLFLLSGCAARLAPAEELRLFPTEENQAAAAAALGVPLLITEEHVAYMQPEKGGRFLPDALMRRGEVCEILYRLMATPIEGSCSFSDVFPSSSYYEAVACLASWGIVTDSTGTFRPNDLISWAQLLTMLSHFYPAPLDGLEPHVGSFLSHRGDLNVAEMLPEIVSFVGVRDHWAAGAVENAVSRGWLSTDEEFNPDAAVTRAEFCRLMNRVLDRQCDDACVLLSGEFTQFSDVPASHIDFGNIMEACYTHEYHKANGIEYWRSTDLTPGYIRTDGALFCVSSDGIVLRDTTVGKLYFGSNGRYTCGYPMVDELIEQLLSKCTSPGMTRSEMLNSVFHYIRSNYKYIPSERAQLPTYMWYGITDFEVPWAYSCMTQGGGNCIAMASTFCLAARALGYQASSVYGQYYRSSTYITHCWTVIPENGVHYLYDPQRAQRDTTYAPSAFYRFLSGNPYPYIYRSYYPDL